MPEEILKWSLNAGLGKSEGGKKYLKLNTISSSRRIQSQIAAAVIVPAMVSCLIAAAGIMGSLMYRARQDQRWQVESHALSLASESEQLIRQGQQELLRLLRDKPDPEGVGEYLANIRRAGATAICEIAFISQNDIGSRMAIWQEGEKSVTLQGDEIKRQMAQLPDSQSLMAIPAGEMALWGPLPGNSAPAQESPSDSGQQILTRTSVRLALSVAGTGKIMGGFFVLGLDLRPRRTSLSRSPSNESTNQDDGDISATPHFFWAGRDGSLVSRFEEALAKPVKRLSPRAEKESEASEGAFAPPSPAAQLDLSCLAALKLNEALRAAESGAISASCGDKGDFNFGYAPVRFQAHADKPAEAISVLVLATQHESVWRRMGRGPIWALAASLLTMLLVGTLSSVWLRRRLESSSVCSLQAIAELPRNGDTEAASTRTDAGGALNRPAARACDRLAILPQGSRQLRGANGHAAGAGGGNGANGKGVASCVDLDGADINWQLERLRQEIEEIAEQDRQVLIVGETATGRRRTAETIHRQSRRALGPFCELNCSKLPDGDLLRRLFGSDAAVAGCSQTAGALAEAQHGTLFIDEIDRMSPLVQQRLLRALSPGGRSNDARATAGAPRRARLIAATCSDLGKLVRDGCFLPELCERFEGGTLVVPLLQSQEEALPLASLATQAWVPPIAAVPCAGDGGGGQLLDLDRKRRCSRPRPIASAQADGQRALDLVLKTPVRPMPTLAEDDRVPAQMHSRSKAKRCDFMPNEAATGEEHALNERQQRALPEIVRRGSISRSQYQMLVGDNLPSRTAIYDLQDLVRKRVLRKEGRGPATRYVPEKGEGQAVC